MRNLVRWLVPDGSHFYDYLEAQGSLCSDAAVALAGIKRGERPGDVHDAVQRVEHQGDDVVRKMEDALARTFVAPIDREDLQRLSSMLDDVIDYTNLVARGCASYGFASHSADLLSMMDVLVQYTAAIREAVPRLRHRDYAALLARRTALRQIERDGDVVYRAAMARLFASHEIDAKELLRQKEVLDAIERAVNHCDHVADLFAHLAVKNG